MDPDTGVLSGVPGQTGSFLLLVLARRPNLGGSCIVNDGALSLIVNDCDMWTCLHGGRCIDDVASDGKFECDCSGTGYSASSASGGVCAEVSPAATQDPGANGNFVPNGGREKVSDTTGLAVLLSIVVVLLLAMGTAFACYVVARNGRRRDFTHMVSRAIASDESYSFTPHDNAHNSVALTWLCRGFGLTIEAVRVVDD